MKNHCTIKTRNIAFSIILLFRLIIKSQGFFNMLLQRKSNINIQRIHISDKYTTRKDIQEQESLDEKVAHVIGVVAPLGFIGAYPCLKLRFPNLIPLTTNDETVIDKEEKSEQTHDGVVLDFVLDTGANMNSIIKSSFGTLQLPLVTESKDLPIAGSAGVGGLFEAGNLYDLGDCKLEGLPPDQNNIFMTNLTAFKLPNSSPVANGLLGIPFFLSFPAGVEFDWSGTDGDPPTVIFYYGRHP